MNFICDIVDLPSMWNVQIHMSVCNWESEKTITKNTDLVIITWKMIFQNVGIDENIEKWRDMKKTDKRVRETYHL